MSGQLSWVGPYLLPEPQADPSNAATASALYNQIMALDAASQANVVFDAIANAPGAMAMNNSQVLRVGLAAAAVGALAGFMIGKRKRR